MSAKVETATPEWLRGAVRNVGGVVGGVVAAPVKGVGGVVGGVARGVGGVAGGVGSVVSAAGRRISVRENEDSGQPGPSRQRSPSPASKRSSMDRYVSIDSYVPPPGAAEASGSVTPPRRPPGRSTSVRFGNFEDDEAGGGADGVEDTPSKTPRSILKKQSSVGSKEGYSLRRDLSREI